MTDNTTIARKAARRKLNHLELANDLGNVSEACRRSSTRYTLSFGSQGLLDRFRGPRNPHPGRATEEQQKDYCLEYRTHGALRVNQQLTLRGSNIGVAAIRGIWQRHDLLPRYQRLLRLERHYRAPNS